MIDSSTKPTFLQSVASRRMGVPATGFRRCGRDAHASWCCHAPGIFGHLGDLLLPWGNEVASAPCSQISPALTSTPPPRPCASARDFDSAFHTLLCLRVLPFFDSLVPTPSPFGPICDCSISCLPRRSVVVKIPVSPFSYPSCLRVSPLAHPSPRLLTRFDFHSPSVLSVSSVVNFPEKFSKISLTSF
jgi:hypothetical protein